jgi:hypothetical protein
MSKLPVFTTKPSEPQHPGPHAQVFRGTDREFNRPVAVKQLADWGARGAAVAQRFALAYRVSQERPARWVRVFAVDEELGRIILADVPNGSLAGALAAGETFSPAQVRHVVIHVLRALAWLHDKNRIHGAVRPSNVFKTDDGFCLSDGVGVEASGAGARTGLGYAPKPAEAPYTAREILEPAPGPVSRLAAPGPRADLYALGLTAIELLLGSEQFLKLFPRVLAKAESWAEWHHGPEQLPSVRELAPQTPPDLARLIDKLVSKNPDDRPADARAARSALEPSGRARERVRRAAFPAAVLVGAVLVFAIGWRVSAATAAKAQTPELDPNSVGLLTRDKDHARGEAAHWKQRAEKAGEERGQQTSRAEKAEKESDELQTKLSAARTQYTALGGQSKQDRERFEAQVKELERACDELWIELGAAHLDRAVLTAQVTVLERARDDLQGKLKKAENDRDGLARGATATQTENARLSNRVKDMEAELAFQTQFFAAMWADSSTTLEKSQERKRRDDQERAALRAMLFELDRVWKGRPSWIRSNIPQIARSTLDIAKNPDGVTGTITFTDHLRDGKTVVRTQGQCKVADGKLTITGLFPNEATEVWGTIKLSPKGDELEIAWWGEPSAKEVFKWAGTPLDRPVGAREPKGGEPVAPKPLGQKKPKDVVNFGTYYEGDTFFCVEILPSTFRNVGGVERLEPNFRKIWDKSISKAGLDPTTVRRDDKDQFRLIDGKGQFVEYDGDGNVIGCGTLK